MPSVRVGLAAGGDLKTVMVQERPKVREALAAAEVEARPGDQLLLNGKAVGMDHQLREGDQVLVCQPIEGGTAVAL